MNWRERVLAGRWSGLAIGAVLFVVATTLFAASPVRQVSDSNYTLLVSEKLLGHGTFALDEAFAHPVDGTYPGYPGVDPAMPLWHHGRPGLPYQVEVAQRGDRVHFYYSFPPGASVLSVPIVAVARLFGLSAEKADGTYDRAGEEALQGIVAAIVGGVLTVVIYEIALLWLGRVLSLVVAVASAFSTQVFSTLTRGLWGCTWGTLLLGVAVLELARAGVARRAPRAWLLATTMAWAWFSRPSFAVHIVAIGLYLLWRHRRTGVLFGAVGLAWLAGFVVLTHHLLGSWLPGYYRYAELRFTVAWYSVTMNLFSPSRGLFVYAPGSVFALALVARFRRALPERSLALLAVAAMGMHMVLLAAVYPTIWGGHCFGARFTVELVPWLALLAILGLRAGLSASQDDARALSHFRVACVAGSFLTLFGVFANGRGAISEETARWNARPRDVNKDPIAVCWNWRYPQFMAGLLRWPIPNPMPSVDTGEWLPVGSGAARAYLLEGWGDDDPGGRLTDARVARLVFRLKRGSMPDAAPRRLSLAMFAAANDQPPLPRVVQVVRARLNGRLLGERSYTTRRPLIEEFELPPGSVADENVLELELPNAVSPRSLGLGNGKMLLGIAVERMRLD